MAKYDKDTKFYWLQLKEDFFEDDAIEWLEEQKPNGRDYAYFYLKLCLKSLKSNGLLIRKVGKILIPYDNQKLAELTKMDFDTVTVAMELLKEIGLIQILENGEIYINQLENLIGSKSIGAFKKQQQRLLSGQKVDKCPPKIEIELEKEKEIEIEIEKEKDGVQMLQQMYNKCTPEIEIEKDINIEKEKEKEEEKDFSTAIEFYNNNINLLTPYEFQKLQDYKEMNNDLIIYAMQKAVLYNKRSFAYIDSILKSWKAQGFITLSQAQNEENEFKKSKQPKEETEEEKIARKIKMLEEANYDGS